MNFVITFLLGLACGSITGWFGHLWTCKRDAKNRLVPIKADFASFIQKQIDAVPKEHVLDFYNRTKFDLREAVITLKEYSLPADRARLNALWEKYKAQIPEAINATEYKIPQSTKQMLHELAGAPYSSETNQDRLRLALKEFYKFSR